MAQTCCRVFLCLLALLGAATLWAADDTGRGLGFTFKSLPAEDLDAIEQQLGYRVGVLVEAVAIDSPAAKTGFKKHDILFSIGKVGVSSRETAEKALAEAAGTVEVFGMRWISAEKTDLFRLSLTIPKVGEKAAEPGKPAELSPETKKKLQALEDAHKAGVLSDAEYAKKRAELLPAVPAAGVPGARKGKTYQHIIGFSFWYPDTWTVKETADGLQLLPPNPVLANGAPAEAYFLTGQPLAGTGITTVNDPRVLAVLDQLVATKISPLLQRKNAPAAVAMTNGQGLRAEWEVQGPAGAISARIYACVLKDYGVILGSFGARDTVLTRDADLQAIFASFGFEAGKQDPAVVGTWTLFSSRYLRNDDNVNFTTDDPRRATMATDQRAWLELRADGAAVHTTIARSIAGGGAAGGTGKVWLDTGDQKTTKQGRWNAGNGTLFIMWADGAMSSWSYTLGPTGLNLQSGNRMEVWQKQ